MIEVFDETFNAARETLQTTKDNLKDCVSFLLRCRSSYSGDLLDELDDRDNETAEGD